MDIRELLLRESQGVARIGKEYITTVLILGHIGVLATLEVVELRRIVALYPARLVYRDRLPAALRSVLVFQTVLNNLELQLSYRADDFATIERRGEELRHTLVHQLVDTLRQLLELHRVGILDIAEQFGRERRDTREFQLFALGEGVADFEVARIVQTYDIARVGVVDDGLLLRHECRRRRELHLLATRCVEIV